MGSPLNLKPLTSLFKKQRTLMKRKTNSSNSAQSHSSLASKENSLIILEPRSSEKTKIWEAMTARDMKTSHSMRRRASLLLRRWALQNPLKSSTRNNSQKASSEKNQALLICHRGILTFRLRCWSWLTKSKRRTWSNNCRRSSPVEKKDKIVLAQNSEAALTSSLKKARKCSTDSLRKDKSNH